MATYYVDNDVGLTGGTGAQQDPYGIESAIAAAAPGDDFHWRGGGGGDVFPGHTLDFNHGGTSTAPVRWIGTDDDWAPPSTGQTPATGVDADDGAYHAIAVTATHQVFENIRARNTQFGRNGSYDGWQITAPRVVLRNCQAHDCQNGFVGTQRGLILVRCSAYDTSYGLYLSNTGTLCHTCAVNDTVNDAFRAVSGGITLVGCRAHSIGASGIRLSHDAVSNVVPLAVDHCSLYDCVDGVKIEAYNGVNANMFSVTNCIFDTCSGYAVNVTTPTGQLGLIANNGSRNCVSGQVPAGRTGLINEGWIALPASPFVDAANGDLALVRATPARGAALDGGDLGAQQRKFTRLPYPVIGLA